MKFVFFFKSRLIFKIFYCFCIFVNKHFINTGTYISKSKQFYNAKPPAFYFYMRTKIPLSFRICISVPSIKIKISMTYVCKEYEVKIKTVQEQWLQQKMNFLLVYNMKIVI